MMHDLRERQVNHGADYQQKKDQHRNKTVLLFVFKHYLYYAPWRQVFEGIK